MSAEHSRGERVPSLDGLRAVSIVSVIVSHVFFDYRQQHDDLALRLVANLGPLGVSIFFGISGFIITSLLRREQEEHGRVDLGAFYIRRTFRILPPFWAYVALTALLGPSFPFAHFRNALLFVANYGESNWWLGHSWSLSVEEQFYLLWPLTFVVAGAVRSRVALWLVLLAPVSRVVTHLITPASALDFMFHTRFDSLLVGCLIALNRDDCDRKRIWRVLGNGHVAFAAVLFLVLGSPLLLERFHGLYHYPVGASLEAVAVGSIILWAIRHPGGRVGAVLNSRPARRLGLISYSLYLWQQPFFSSELLGSVLGRFPVNCLAPLVLAELSYRMIERPSLKARDRVLAWYFGRRKRQAVTAM